MLAGEQSADRLVADVGSEQEELDGDQPLRTLLGGVREHTPAAEAPHDDEAGDTFDESRPNPTSAIEEATAPAVIATAPSTVIHASDSHDSSRTRRASSP